VLGGLVRTDNSKSRSKVPFLGDIPLLGMFFRADSKKRNRTELMVLLTPYVLKTPQEALDETRRLYSNSRTSEAKWHTGWSDSTLPQDAKSAQSKAQQKYFPPAGRMKKETLLDTFHRNKDAGAPLEEIRSKPLSEIETDASVAVPNAEVVPEVTVVAPPQETPAPVQPEPVQPVLWSDDPSAPVPAK
jgi:hypothetical protein